MSRKASQPTLDLDEDGWFSPADKKTEEGSSSQEEGELQIKGFKEEMARSILQQKDVSLEPDMMFGWRPKLPSCPLPLTYPNYYVDSLMKVLQKDSRYSVAYVGPKYVNSVQVNQQHSYTWKYRDRYSLNLALIQQAVRNVGKEENNMLPASQIAMLPNTTGLKQRNSYLQKNVFKDHNENINSDNYSFLPSIYDDIKYKRAVSKVSRSTSDTTQCQYAFDSQFESGNLQLAVRVKRNQYDCFMRSDTNTKGHTNWYFFRVNNRNQIGELKINICNFTKHRNLYSKGMKPYVLPVISNADENGENKQKNSKGFVFNNQNIDQLSSQWSQNLCYEVNFVQRYCRYGIDYKNFQLQFKYNFTDKNQTVYFAYAVPYTYSKLEKFITQVVTNNPEKVHMKRLCQTLGGVDIPLLRITNPQPQSEQDKPKKSQRNLAPSKINKKAVLITGRIHPGQSNASHVLEGFIRQLLRNTNEANNLRNLFVFYVIPMLNPDGVIAGNFRTSYSGKDLNRQFKNMSNPASNVRYIYPEIFYLNQLSVQLKNTYQKGFQFYMDFHGHSVKKGLFCYGPDHPPSNPYFFKARALAKLMEQMHPIFSYKKSIFTVNQHKMSTGRAHMLWKIKIPMTFTFEISNGMYQAKDKKDLLLNHSVLLEAGKCIYRGFYRYIQLQLRLPRDTLGSKSKPESSKAVGSSKRIVNSSKSMRPMSKPKTFKLTSRERKSQNIDCSNNLLANEQKVNDKVQSDPKIVSLKQIISKRNKSKPGLKKRYNLGGQRIPQSSQNFEQLNDDMSKTSDLLSLFQQIKKQTRQSNQQLNVDYEGGSDSEGSQEDLQKNETQNLFKQILSRNKDARNGYKMNNWRAKKCNLDMRKKVTNLTQKNQPEIFQQKQKEKPKIRVSRLEELSKPMVLLHGQMRIVRKGVSVQYDKVVLAQKNFTLNL